MAVGNEQSLMIHWACCEGSQLLWRRHGLAWIRHTILTAGDGFTAPAALGLDPSRIAPAVLQFGTALIQGADGNPRAYDVQWRPSNGSGAVASGLQALGAAQGNGTSAAGVFDSAFHRRATAAAGNANATGFAIGSTGFTTGQATAAALEQAVTSITPESYAAFQSVGLNALRLQRETLTNQAGRCRDTGWVIGAKGRRTPLCVFATGGKATATIDGRAGLSGYNSASPAASMGSKSSPATCELWGRPMATARPA